MSQKDYKITIIIFSLDPSFIIAEYLMKIFEEETDKLSLLDKIFAFLPLIMIIIYAMREHRLKYRHQGAGNGFLRQTTPSKHDKTPPTNSQESEAHFIYFD